MDDLISRQAAIDMTWAEPSYADPLNVLTEVRDRIKALPSAETKTGEWVWSDEDASWKCGCCDCVFEEIDWKPTYNYCPNCGAKMEVSDD